MLALARRRHWAHLRQDLHSMIPSLCLKAAIRQSHAAWNDFSPTWFAVHDFLRRHGRAENHSRVSRLELTHLAMRPTEARWTVRAIQMSAEDCIYLYRLFGSAYRSRILGSRFANRYASLRSLSRAGAYVGGRSRTMTIPRLSG